MWLGQTMAQQPHSMQSNRLRSSAASNSRARACQYNCCGNSRAGHTVTHSPQRMQGCASGVGRTCSGASASTQLVALMTGTSSAGSAKPIIGPPINTRPGVSVKPPACATRCDIRVPRRTRRLHGWAMASPVTVMMRSIKGSAKHTARPTARTVPGLWQTMPRSSGRPSLGTSRPVSV